MFIFLKADLTWRALFGRSEFVDFHCLDWCFFSGLYPSRFIGDDDFIEKFSVYFHVVQQITSGIGSSLAFGQQSISRRRVWKSSVMICCTELYAISDSLEILSIIHLPSYTSANFFNVFIGSGRERTTRVLIVFKRHVVALKARISVKHSDSFKDVIFINSENIYINRIWNTATE